VRSVDEWRKSRSSDSEVVLLTPPYRMTARSGNMGAFVARYSGATARDFHPVPYSLQAVTWSTLSPKEKTTTCGVSRFKELPHICPISGISVNPFPPYFREFFALLCKLFPTLVLSGKQSTVIRQIRFILSSISQKGSTIPNPGDPNPEC